jgi:hypothetical protein
VISSAIATANPFNSSVPINTKERHTQQFKGSRTRNMTTGLGEFDGHRLIGPSNRCKFVDTLMPHLFDLVISSFGSSVFKIKISFIMERIDCVDI